VINCGYILVISDLHYLVILFRSGTSAYLCFFSRTWPQQEFSTSNEISTWKTKSESQYTCFDFLLPYLLHGTARRLNYTLSPNSPTDPQPVARESYTSSSQNLYCRSPIQGNLRHPYSTLTKYLLQVESPRPPIGTCILLPYLRDTGQTPAKDQQWFSSCPKQTAR